MGHPLIVVSVVREEQPQIVRSAQDDIAKMEFVLSQVPKCRDLGTRMFVVDLANTESR